LIHTYAQDHIVFEQPSCLTGFRPGGFLFESKAMVAATKVMELRIRPTYRTRRNKILCCPPRRPRTATSLMAEALHS